MHDAIHRHRALTVIEAVARNCSETASKKSRAAVLMSILVAQI